MPLPTCEWNDSISLQVRLPKVAYGNKAEVEAVCVRIEEALLQRFEWKRRLIRHVGTEVVSKHLRFNQHLGMVAGVLEFSKAVPSCGNAPVSQNLDDRAGVAVEGGLASWLLPSR